MVRRYSAKVLLFGEYTLLSGSSALIIPFKKYSGRLRIVKNPDSVQYLSNTELVKFHGYLSAHQSIADYLDINRFFNDVSKGLFYDSDIPYNYGIGSSGSLVAAVYDEYRISTDVGLKSVKEHLSLMEKYFHGESSGLDPLVIFHSFPLLLENSGSIISLKGRDLNFGNGRFFLLDTQIKSGTRDLVHGFLKNMKNKSYSEKISKQLIPVTEKLTSSAYMNSVKDISGLMKQLSQLQFQLFRDMIPESFVNIWQLGLSTEAYSMKLCGSGGGGFVLVYSENRRFIDSALPDIKLLELI